MGRKKRETKLIQCKTERKQTYKMRIRGLIKKAYELSVFCDIDIALISFSPSGELAHFSNKPEPWPKSALQCFCQTIIPNMPEEKRAELQLSQDIFNLINTIAAQDDANNQQGCDVLLSPEAEEKETMREIRCHQFSSACSRIKMFFPGTFDSVQEWERHQQFLKYALVEVVRRRQQIMSQSQHNPSLSTQNVECAIADTNTTLENRKGGWDVEPNRRWLADEYQPTQTI